jgi:hypothetical protein
MSCAGKGYGTNPASDAYLYAQFSSYSNNATNSVRPKTTRNCRKFKSSYPSFTPILSDLSITSSQLGGYSLVYVNGYNFLPNGTTFIKFGNYGYLPAIYYSSCNLSFVAPSNAAVGNYQVQVANRYDNNFSPRINQSYPGDINLSNSITYTIT